MDLVHPSKGPDHEQKECGNDDCHPHVTTSGREVSAGGE